MAELNATLIAREDINPSLSIFRVKPDAGVYSFKAGQFAVMGLPFEPRPDMPVRQDGDKPAPKSGEIIRRAYSIASPPHEKEFIEFYIQLVPEGLFTPMLWKLQVGGRLWFGPKAAGTFTFDSVPQDKDVLFMGTGTGLAPYLAMIHEHMETSEVSRKFVVAIGVRYIQDLGYREKLEQLAQQRASFIYLPTLSRKQPEDHWDGHVGRVESLVTDGTVEHAIGGEISPDKFHIFLCGNPGMIDGMQKHFEERGFKEHKPRDPGNLHLEKYW